MVWLPLVILGGLLADGNGGLDPPMLIVYGISLMLGGFAVSWQGEIKTRPDWNGEQVELASRKKDVVEFNYIIFCMYAFGAMLIGRGIYNMWTS